jgi:hypothetical protein
MIAADTTVARVFIASGSALTLTRTFQVACIPAAIAARRTTSSVAVSG